MKQIQIDTNFHLSLILKLKNPEFFYVELTTYQQLTIFLSFIMELQYKSIMYSHYSSMVS